MYPITGQTVCLACPGASQLFFREKNLSLRVSGFTWSDTAFNLKWCLAGLLWKYNNIKLSADGVAGEATLEKKSRKSSGI